MPGFDGLTTGACVRASMEARGAEKTDSQLEERWSEYGMKCAH